MAQTARRQFSPRVLPERNAPPASKLTRSAERRLAWTSKWRRRRRSFRDQIRSSRCNRSRCRMVRSIPECRRRCAPADHASKAIEVSLYDPLLLQRLNLRLVIADGRQHILVEIRRRDAPRNARARRHRTSLGPALRFGDVAPHHPRKERLTKLSEGACDLNDVQAIIDRVVAVSVMALTGSGVPSKAKLVAR